MAHDEAKMKEAYRWLEKAINYEAEGKSASIVDKCLDKAVNLEREAIGIAA